MANIEERPSTYDNWSDSARKAYDEMAKRATMAERKLDKLSNKILHGVSLDDTGHDTLSWNMAVTNTLKNMLLEASSTLDPSKIFETVTKTLCTYLNVTSVYICDYDPENMTFTVLQDYFGSGASDKERQSDVGVVYPMTKALENTLINTDDYWIMYPPYNEVVNLYQEHYREYNVQTVLTAPMFLDEKMIGFIELWDTRSEREFTTNQRNLLVTVASQIAGSVNMAKLHRAVSKSEAQYRTLMDSIPSGVAKTDTYGKIKYINQHFAKLMNMSFDELINQDLNTIWQSKTQASHIPDEYELQDDDGTIRWIQVNRAPLPGVNGKSEGKAVIFSDITKRKAAEDYAINMGIEQERTQVLSEFIQNASHEFYTPLSIINTRVHMVKRQLADPKLLDRLSSVEEQVSIIQELVQSLSEMTKLRTIDTLKTQQHNIVQLSQEILSGMIPRIERKQQELIFNSTHDNISILCNPSILAQAFLRLFDNAIRYTPDSGTIEINIYTQDEMAHIRIIDNGIGINKDAVERVFDSFFRADTARTSRGFGLGLSIARQVIELHEGDIMIHSEEDAGTIVSIELPLMPVKRGIQGS